jgi:hypothetical protein
MFLVQSSSVWDILFVVVVRRFRTNYSTRLWELGIRGVASEGLFPPRAGGDVAVLVRLGC